MKALALVVLAACTGDIDPPWQLDHDRIIAVRATPPHVMPGATAQLDLFVGHKGAPTSMQAPDAAQVVSPHALASALVGATLTAPMDLSAARSELKLADGVPVPVVVGVLAGSLAATKTVWFGDAHDNPTLDDVTVDGAPPDTSIMVPPDMDVPLAVSADDAIDIVNWLTSCGTMHDYDLHAAHVHVLPADPQSGELALVLRDNLGGVAWQVWPIAAQ